jgi:hypothetical protein
VSRLAFTAQKMAESDRFEPLPPSHRRSAVVGLRVAWGLPRQPHSGTVGRGARAGEVVIGKQKMPSFTTDCIVIRSFFVAFGIRFGNVSPLATLHAACAADSHYFASGDCLAPDN